MLGGKGEAVDNQYNVVTSPPSDKFNEGSKSFCVATSSIPTQR